ncbi:MAG: circadian clock KaiB family protein [Desulfococcaceae bacterium]
MKEEPKNARADFERALADRESKRYMLRLYVSGATFKSMRAISNIRKICEEHLKGRFELEVIDTYQKPEMARSDQIVALPTLIKELPPPLRRVIGDLSDADRVLVGLDLAEKEDRDDES